MPIISILLIFVLVASGCKRTPEPLRATTSSAPTLSATASSKRPSSGGLRLDYALEVDPGAPADAAAQAMRVVKRRLDALNLEADVYLVGETIRVDLPGITSENAERVRRELTIGKLEIREVDDSLVPADPLPKGTLELPATMLDGSTKPVRIRPGGIGSASVEDASVRNTQFGIVVDVRFNPEGAAAFAKMSRDNVDKPLAIVLDGKVVSMPIVKTPITDGRVQITMGFGDPAQQLADAEALVRALKAGAIHGRLVLESEILVPPLN
ncbi:MAG: hypothetical protein IPM54_27840 [Polyangiaceae bacterium]|nr:hypothetical protein [Polyangiaceae bacterium]